MEQWFQVRAAIGELLKVEHRDPDIVIYRMGRNLAKIDPVIDPVRSMINKKVDPVRRANPGRTEEWLTSETRDLVEPILNESDEMSMLVVAPSQLNLPKVNSDAFAILMRHGIVEEIEPVNHNPK
jgi:hypothetical protein